MQVPGHSGRSSGFSVVVVVVVVAGVVVGSGCLNGGGFLGGGLLLKMLPRPKAGASTGSRELATLPRSDPPPPPPPPPPPAPPLCCPDGGVLDGLDGRFPPPPPPPSRDPMAGANTGKSAAAVDPASEFPVAALINVPKT